MVLLDCALISDLCTNAILMLNNKRLLDSYNKRIDL